MSVSECRKFERKVAFHLSPSLLGVKCAGIISVNEGEFDIEAHIRRFNSMTRSGRLKMRRLFSCGKRSLIMVYRVDLLEKRISSESEFLAMYGYPGGISADEALDILSSRISCESGFPHEIGVFLDYPIEDVKGFIRHKGQNFKLCGYWKVYENVDRSRKLFEKYDWCRSYLCNKLDRGCDLYQALKLINGGIL